MLAPAATASSRRKSFRAALRTFLRQWDLQVMILPAILLILLFSYTPMFGVDMAFQEYELGDLPGLASGWA